MANFAYAQQSGILIYATVNSNTNPTPTPTPITPSYSGSGGGSFVSAGATVNFSGRAYPLSKITILKDYLPLVTTIAGPDSQFSVSVSNLNQGKYNFAVYGEDGVGRKSEMFSFSIIITPNITVDISGIFISPTIDVDKTEVAKGDNITIFGQSIPKSKVVISVHSNNEIFETVPTDKNGVYLYKLDTSTLDIGEHSAKSKAILDKDISTYGKIINFTVGDKNIFNNPNVGTSTDLNLATSTNTNIIEANISNKVFSKGDLNHDGGVGITDYSILTFWYDKKNPPKKVDLNSDGVVNLIDFSILAYYWNGK